MGSWTYIGSLKEDLSRLEKVLLNLQIKASRRWTEEPQLEAEIKSTKKRIVEIQAQLKRVNRG